MASRSRSRSAKKMEAPARPAAPSSAGGSAADACGMLWTHGPVLPCVSQTRTLHGEDLPLDGALDGKARQAQAKAELFSARVLEHQQRGCRVAHPGTNVPAIAGAVSRNLSPVSRRDLDGRTYALSEPEKFARVPRAAFLCPGFVVPLCGGTACRG